MGDSISKIVKGTLSAVTLGTSDMLLGGLEADMPEMPKGPDSMATGQQAATKGTGTLDENKDAKTNARKTARKGTSAFRIPLANVTTGATASGGTGLKI